MTVTKREKPVCVEITGWNGNFDTNHKKSCINGNVNLIKYFSRKETSNTKGKRKQRAMLRSLSAMTHSENSGIHE